MTTNTSSSRMKRWFPTTAHPLIVSAPMDFVTNPRLATEVTKAGGLGFIQGGRDFAPESPVLASLEDQLRSARDLLLSSPPQKGLDKGGNDDDSGSVQEEEDSSSGNLLPVGVGFVTYSPSVRHFAQTTTPILEKYRPAAVWLFAPSPSLSSSSPSPSSTDPPAQNPHPHQEIISSIRRRHRQTAGQERQQQQQQQQPGERRRPPLPPPWKPKIVVQVGTVAAAREAASHGADIIVAQGVDAGGHQWGAGAGIVSLVPEIRKMLRDEFLPGKQQEGERGGGGVAVWAAGGIVEGSGVAAALALGAEGVVLGTRYMVATESDAQDYKRRAILETSDGGTSTVKSQLHDHVQGNHSWPDLYDGRAVIHPSYRDHEAGLPLEENKRRFREMKEKGDVSRMVTWSGTGVGLVREELPAAEITRRVRDEAVKVIAELKAGI
ncbi:FMN-dependent 2-nitropropane dioxygenase [Xylariomycetidae sp. FL2044]|nr:FMN-dependent 2-nitropropane dioxygenase [Xylariomycetidae sp. FL2044]